MKEEQTVAKIAGDEKVLSHRLTPILCQPFCTTGILQHLSKSRRFDHSKASSNTIGHHIHDIQRNCAHPDNVDARLCNRFETSQRLSGLLCTFQEKSVRLSKTMREAFQASQFSYALLHRKTNAPSGETVRVIKMKRKILNRILRWSLLMCWSVLVSCNDIATGPEVGEWAISTPEAQHLDESLLTDLSNRIDSGTYGDIHSLLIVRNGYLVFEKYYRGYGRDDKHPVYSVTKSVSSALVGIALDQKKIADLGKELLSFFPEYPAVANLDSNKQKISLADVLTMRAGFLWDESSAPYGDPGNSTFQLASSSNWIKYMLDLPMSGPPGSRFRYNSGCSILLSGILRNTTGMNADAFCRENLFSLLGIADYQWETGPQGITNTGWGLSLRPRDMLKFGAVFLNRGMWEGRSVVPGSWVDQSTSPAVTLSGGYSYGYQWWLLPLGNVVIHTPLANDIKFAWGYGGQFIFVIPSLNMVVVSTAGNYTGDDSQAIRFLQDYIARAAE